MDKQWVNSCSVQSTLCSKYVGQKTDKTHQFQTLTWLGRGHKSALTADCHESLSDIATTHVQDWKQLQILQILWFSFEFQV